MEIGGISSTLVSGSLFARSSTQAEVNTVVRPERSNDDEHSHRKHNHHHHHHRQGSRALGVFRQELRQSLSANFRATITTSQSGYGQVTGQPSSDDVAADTLGAAQRVVAEEPVAGSRSMIRFRQSVEEAVAVTREIVGNDDDLGEVEGAVGRVVDGLGKLEDEASRNVESTASILAIESKTRQRTSIKIRTQEGDVVKLDLKQRSSFSATDVAVSNESGSATSTEIELSSSSRLRLRVEGDLNEAELGAIQNVFAQAELIADEFFGGDLFAALDLASAFEFDAEQLSRVNMRFRSRAVSSAAFSSIQAKHPAVSSAEPTSGSGPVVAATPQIDYAAPVAVVDPASVSGDNTAIAPDAPEANKSPQAAPAYNALSSFFDLVSSFLRSVSEGFESASESKGESAKLHFSQSFKLELLQAVMSVMEPEANDDTTPPA